MTMLIKGGRVVDPSQDLDATLDVLIDAGEIRELGANLEVGEGVEVLDAEGRLVASGTATYMVKPPD